MYASMHHPLSLLTFTRYRGGVNCVGGGALKILHEFTEAYWVILYVARLRSDFYL